MWSRSRDGKWHEAGTRGTREEMEESVRWYREQGSDMIALPVGEKPDTDGGNGG